MFSDDITELAQQIVTQATQKHLTITTAESCTGGLIAGALTEISGSSAMFNQGYVTYANEAKQALVNVPLDALEHHGAVSPQVAAAMASGAREAAHADIAVAVTGIAGPGGGSPEKPVGLVWFGLATSDGVITQKEIFPDQGRSSIRQATVKIALQLVLNATNAA